MTGGTISLWMLVLDAGLLLSGALRLEVASRPGATSRPVQGPAHQAQSLGIADAERARISSTNSWAAWRAARSTPSPLTTLPARPRVSMTPRASSSR